MKLIFRWHHMISLAEMQGFFCFGCFCNADNNKKESHAHWNSLQPFYSADIAIKPIWALVCAKL